MVCVLSCYGVHWGGHGKGNKNNKCNGKDCDKKEGTS